MNEMSELFEVDKSGISHHLKNIFQTGELPQEGSRSIQRELEYFNLDAIISAGYRVNSIRGTQFRKWATQRLREYIIKGYIMDDDQLKQSNISVTLWSIFTFK